MDFADKYGVGLGTSNIREDVVNFSSQKLGLNDCIGIVNVDKILDKQVDDCVKLSSVVSSSYDLVTTENYINFSRMLGVDIMSFYEILGALDDFTKKRRACRILNTFREYIES